MEHREHNNITKHINKLISLVEGFYTDEHFTESGTTYRFITNKSKERLRFLIEGVYYNPDILSLSDQKEFFDIMSIDLNKYIQETMQIDDLQNDNKEFYVFIIDFNQKTQRAYSIMKRNEIIFPLKQVLHQGLQTNEAITHRLQNKHIQVKNITNTNEGKAALIQTKNKEYFFVNVDKASIIYKAGIEKEKRYKFSDTKIFIFTEQSDIKPIIHEQIKIKKLTEPNTTIKNFLLQIAREYNNDLDPIIQKMQTVKDIETVTIGQITEDLQKVTTLLGTLRVKLGIQAKQYNIFIEHQSKTLQYIGLFQSYQIPKKLANNYKEKESIQIIVNNETQAIITNGEVYDIFDIT